MVTFSIDSSSENIRVPEQNESVTVCFSRMGDTVNDYTVTFEAKMNTAGMIANGNLTLMMFLLHEYHHYLSLYYSSC